MGECGIGKTSLIYGCLQHLKSDIKVGGFSTYFEKKSPEEKILYISPYNCENTVETAPQKKAVMHWLSGNITIFQNAFDEYGSQLLQQSINANLIVMDELGRFEENAEQFKKEVFNCLNGNIPVLGVIRKLDSTTWLDDVKNHPNVTILHIEKEHLEVTKKRITEHFIKLL